ncbi:hypothetical protein GCM10009677_49260 [Sphaerisporangium rubeum]
MRKARALLMSAVLATGMTLSIGTAPAHAGTETLQGIYQQYNDCERVGGYGDDQGWWSGYRCEFKSQYYYYFLYA